MPTNETELQDELAKLRKERLQRREKLEAEASTPKSG
jgi:hypothetical protein